MISENAAQVLAMPQETTIGEVAGDVIGEKSFIIPRLMTQGMNDIQITGAALFMGKTNKMLDWLGDNEIKAYKWIMGQAENGVLDVEVDGQRFVFETGDQASKITYERKEDVDHFDVEIRVEGWLVESWLDGIDIDDLNTIEQLEGEVSRTIHAQTTELVQKMQDDYHADIFECHQHVKQNDYEYWKQIEDQWDGQDAAFSKAQFNINVETKIRHHMLQETFE